MIVTVGKVTAEEADRMFRQITNETEKFEPEVQTEIRRVFALLSASLGTEAFLEALGQGDTEAALQALTIAEVRSEFIERLRPIIEKAVDSAGFTVASISQDVDAAGRTVLFQPQQSRAIRIAERHSSRLVTNISEETRRSIRGSIARAIEVGENPRVAAKRLRGTVGLIDKHARAVDRFFFGLLEQGIDIDQAQRSARAYADRLLRWRTETIARTEMLWSANSGKMEYWNQLADAGIIDRTTIQRVWVAALDDRTCPQCWPMDGVVVETLDAPFRSDALGRVGETLQPRPEGPIYVEFPPLHPNCRCTTVLE